MELGSKSQPQKCDETKSFCMDRLSDLPNEIIVSILSFLKLKEAARTSVLSRRWGHLWKFTTGSLDFDDSSLQYLRKKSFFKTLPGIDRDRYVSWVNHVLQLHQAHTIDEFKVDFPLKEECNKLDIDNWILFSLRKKVKRLSLDFDPIITGLARDITLFLLKFLMGFPKFPELRSLKKLTLISPLLHFRAEASPFLQKFTLERQPTSIQQTRKNNKIEDL
ncbi:f-box/lrr-repeat protein [Quercus suber]|uniref:F-box/lrr-repeat protein n=1 Tax=Quercus suber TaxID=58331 RepID=A0AAW0KS95_QUESU